MAKNPTIIHVRVDRLLASNADEGGRRTGGTGFYSSTIPRNSNMVDTAHLQQELEIYEKNKEKLVGESAGKWVVIHADEVAGVWDTYEDALKAGYSRYGVKQFLVKQVLVIEQVQFIHRHS